MAAIVEGGAECVVIKRGAEGAAFLQREEKEGPTAVPGFSVEVQTTVGAGDSFFAASKGPSVAPSR